LETLWVGYSAPVVQGRGEKGLVRIKKGEKDPYLENFSMLPNRAAGSGGLSRLGETEGKESEAGLRD